MVDKVVVPMVVSPVVGFVLAYLFMLAALWAFRRRNPHRVTRSIVTAWVLTIPAAAAVASVAYLVVHLLLE